MKIEQIQTEKLIPYARNSRTHSDEQIAQIMASIKEFGFTNPILIDEDGQIIAGHGRTVAAQRLQMKAVPCIRLSHLTPAQKKAYVIADNKLALNAGWDDELLKIELSELREEDFDLLLTGFDDDELNKLLAEAVTEGLVDEDQVPEAPEEPKTKLGDIYQLGRHRLMCGDSTSIDAVEKLMGGQLADLVFTDPPYGVGYTPKASASNKNTISSARKLMVGTLIANDANPENALQVTKDAIALHHKTKAFFICCDWKSFSTMLDALKEVSLQPKACIVWDKGGPYQHLDRFAKRHEFILYCGAFGGEKTFDTDIWRFPREFRHDHPTPKPVELVAHAIESASDTNNIVVDCFAGSGSTLIACEKTNRQARIIELDPKYCDVIVKRWEDFTGKKAELLNADIPA
jgi:DNA modification methylase